MPLHSHGVAVLDEPLAQFDRLLRDVQVALAPEREPAPPAQPRSGPPAQPRSGPPAEILPQRPEPQSSLSRGRPGPLREVLERTRRERPAPANEPEPKPAKSGCCHPNLSGALSELAELPAALEELRTSLGPLEELRASLGELLENYRGALDQSLAATTAPPLVAPTRGNEFTLVAGPFVALETVRAFERTLLALPGVEQVAIRGYEGADRAVLDVRLGESNS